MVRKIIWMATASLCASLCGGPLLAAALHLNDLDYFEAQGLSVLAYQIGPTTPSYPAA
jgi:hypothetical protein